MWDGRVTGYRKVGMVSGRGREWREEGRSEGFRVGFKRRVGGILKRTKEYESRFIWLG